MYALAVRGRSRIGPTRRDPGGTFLQLLGYSRALSIVYVTTCCVLHVLAIEEEIMEKLQKRE